MYFRTSCVEHVRKTNPSLLRTHVLHHAILQLTRVSRLKRLRNNSIDNNLKYKRVPSQGHRRTQHGKPKSVYLCKICVTYELWYGKFKRPPLRGWRLYLKCPLLAMMRGHHSLPR